MRFVVDALPNGPTGCPFSHYISEGYSKGEFKCLLKRDSSSCTLPGKCTSFILLDNLVVTHGLKGETLKERTELCNE